jgi:hypothetical protein
VWRTGLPNAVAVSGSGPVRYLIYYGMREYARAMGDPCLGEVEAESKEAAEALGRERFDTHGAGAWAVEVRK